MPIGIPSKYSVSEIVEYLKGKSCLILFNRHANLKYKYGNRMFWRRGYDVDTGSKGPSNPTSARGPSGPTVGKNTKKYVNNQLKKDWMTDQISFSDPFTSEKVKTNKNSRQRRQLGK